MSNVLVSNSVYGPEASALFARMSVQPSDSRKMIISETIYQLQVAGIWNKLDIIYFTAAHDSQSAGLNWKSTENTITAINSPLFTTDRGYSGNGTTNYVNTNYNPLTGITWTQNSASFGIYSRTNITENKSSGAANGSGTGLALGFRNTSNQIGSRINSLVGDNLIVSNSDSRGLFVVNRSSSTAQQVYKNGIQLSANTATSQAVNSLSLYVLANNVAGVASLFSSFEAAAIFCGAGDIDQTIFYNIIQWYMTKIGANV